MQMKIKIDWLQPFGLAIIRKLDNVKCCWRRGVYPHTLVVDQYIQSKQMNTVSGNSSALVLHPKETAPQFVRDMYSDVHCSAPHGGTNMEIVWQSISGEVGRWYVVDAQHVTIKGY